VRSIIITSAVIAQFLVFPLSAMTTNTVPNVPSRNCETSCSVYDALLGNANVTIVFKTSNKMPHWLVKKQYETVPSNQELRDLTVLRTA
jgi:hypothetical protein